MANPLFSALPLLRSSSSDRTPATAIRGNAPKRGLLQWWRPLALAVALLVPTAAFAQSITITGISGPDTITEGETAVFMLTFSAASANDLTLYYSLPTGETNTDFDSAFNTGQGGVTIRNTTSFEVSVPVTNDTDDENAEAFTIEFVLENQTEGTEHTRSATLTVAASDKPVTAVSVTGPTGEVAGGANAEFMVTLTSDSAEDVELTWSLTGSGGFTTADYGTIDPASPHTRMWGGSGTTDTFTVSVPITANTEGEAAETFTMTVNATRPNTTPPSPSPATATATIEAGPVPPPPPPPPGSNNPARRADALEYVLAAFHRSTMDGLGAAIEGATRSGMSSSGGDKQMKLAGQNLFPNAGNSEPPPAGTADMNLGAHAGLDNDALTISDLRRALPATDFRFALNHGDGAGVGAMSVWGGGNHSAFERRPEKQFHLEGGAHSGHLGADFRVREDVVVGLVLNHAFSDGDIDFKDTAATNIGDGKVDTGLTSLHPFARWELGAMSFWGTLGIGSGHADLEDKDGPVDGISTTMRMATAGGRAHLWSMGSMGLAFKGDASVVRSEFNGKAGIDDGHANTSRIRMALEGNNQIELQSGAGLRSEAEIGLRVDGGAVGAGTGLDFGGNINYSRANFIVSVRGNVLATHSDDDDFNQWEFGLSLNHDATREGRGMKFSLEPTWGVPSGESAVWDLDTLGAAASDGDDDSDTDMGMDGKLSYGLGVLGSRGVLTPFSEMHWSKGEVETLRLGTSLDLEMSRALSFQFAAHQEYAHETAERASERDYYLGLKTRLSF